MDLGLEVVPASARLEDLLCDRVQHDHFTELS